MMQCKGMQMNKKQGVIQFFGAMVVLLCSSIVLAKEFKSVRVSTILFDAPSAQAQKIAIAPIGMPVEVLVKLDNGFVKIKDSEGAALWVDGKALSSNRTYVFVRSGSVRAAPNTSAKIVLGLRSGVLVEGLAAVNAGWVKVKHRDGAVGFVNIEDVWGE
jgi:SH3 domain protein